MADSNVNYEEEVDSACTSPSDEKQLSTQVVSDDESSNPDMTTLKSQRAGDIDGSKGKSLENVKKDKSRWRRFKYFVRRHYRGVTKKTASPTQRAGDINSSKGKHLKNVKEEEARWSPFDEERSVRVMGPPALPPRRPLKDKSVENVRKDEARWRSLEKEYRYYRDRRPEIQDLSCPLTRHVSIIQGGQPALPGVPVVPIVQHPPAPPPPDVLNNN